MSGDACACCDELEKELELCHEALNRSGVDPLLVAAGSALEAAAVTFSDGDGDERGVQRLLDAACDYGAMWRRVNGEAPAGATSADAESAEKTPRRARHTASKGGLEL
jgi:hypothetical protein